MKNKMLNVSDITWEFLKEVSPKIIADMKEEYKDNPLFLKAILNLEQEINERKNNEQAH